MCSSTLHAQSLKKIFTTTEWLADHLDDENIIVFHVETREAYDEGHIPGAQFIASKDFSTTVGDDLYTELRSADELRKLLLSRGITDDSEIVLYYGSSRFAWTYRLYFTFDYLGLADQVKILDGGLTTWTKEGRPTTTDEPQPVPSSPEALTLAINEDILASKEDIAAAIDMDRMSIIDARTKEYYSGEKDGDGHYKRPGHIGNARNITWTRIIDEDQKLLPEEVLRQFYEDQEISKKDEVITYCHVGLRATVLYTISKGLGHKVSMYDGSFNEWDRLDDAYPVRRSN